MTLDETRGLLYLPTSTPGDDYYGGKRLGANLFAESLVCLDASTGKMSWYFQAVHHGLWDYDFTGAPNLLTLNVDGHRIDAVAEVSKQGFTYVFDRVSGRPVWPIEERAVDATTDVPGERPSPTQPFPTKPPPFAPQGVSLADANDLTPEVKAIATTELEKYRLGPLFTPPSMRGTLMRPGNNGGANWGGAAVDPETSMLYVRASTIPLPHQICKQEPRDFPKSDVEYSDQCGAGGPAPGRGQDPGARGRGGRGGAGAVEDGDGGGAGRRGGGALRGLPITKPPYGLLTALNLTQGTMAWQVPAGEGSALIRSNPLLKDVKLPDRLGSETNSGPSVTKGGLVFANAGERYLYVYDKTTGKEITRLATPYRPSGTPMTYVAKSGKQFVVVATGAGPDAALVAFALP
jgi:glucose dehydrogenase